MDKGTPGRRYLLGNENLRYRDFMAMVARCGAARPRPAPRLAVGVAGRVGQRLSRIDEHRFAGLDPYVLRSMQQGAIGPRSGPSRSWAPRTPVVLAVEDAYRWFREHGYC